MTMLIDKRDVSLRRGNRERSHWDNAFLHLPIRSGEDTLAARTDYGLIGNQVGR